MIIRAIYLNFLLAIFLVLPDISFATHLMGGSITYEYKGRSGSNYRYLITVEMYRDAFSSTSPVPFDNSIAVGIYYNNTSRSRYQQEYFTLGTQTTIKPPSGGSSCAFDPNITIVKGIYQKEILLPASTTGYHLYHVRCCRNNLTNLDEKTGQTYYAFIPPNFYEDSAPYFSDIPTPYICTWDTISISYAATDIDNDSLVYSLVHPWAGGSEFDPIPNLPANLSLPIINGNYKTSYSAINPFGNNGMAQINSSTGLLTIYAPQAGLFAIAVDVKSYRNGVLLTTIRRDIQIIVLNCPPNDVPRRIEPTSISFIYQAGEKINFDLLYRDIDLATKDNYLSFSVEGDIFGAQSGMSTPYPTITKNSNIRDSVRNTFNWDAKCEHARSTPYFFTVKVRDSGCPQKTRTDVYQIYIEPFVGADSVSGPINVCALSEDMEYNAHGSKDGSTIVWSVEGGSILSGQGTKRVRVSWSHQGLGKLHYYETSKFGCGPRHIVKDVTIYALPSVDPGINRVVCSRDTIQLGNINADQSLTYLWTPATDLDNQQSHAPLFSIKNTTSLPHNAKYYLKVTDHRNCSSLDSVILVVNPEPLTSGITGDTTPCYRGIFPYEVHNSLGSKYYWFAEGGMQVSGGNTNMLEIHWLDTLSGKLSVYEENIYGCSGDSQHIEVIIIKPGAVIYGPSVVCPNTVNIDYWVNYREGSYYDWFVTYGYRSDGNDRGPKIKVNWPDSGLALISVVETTIEGCVSDTARFPVVISYHLKTSPIEGDTIVCEYSFKPYTVMNVNGSNYHWTIEGGTVSNGNGSAGIEAIWGTKGMAMLKVLETSYDSVNNKACIGDTVYQQVLINPVPTTTPINGKENVCENDTVRYYVDGFSDSYYHWRVDALTAIILNNGSSAVDIVWTQKGDFMISVVELSKDSCYGPLRIMIVSVNPTPETSLVIGPDALCYPDTRAQNYQATGFANSVFNWTVDGGIIVSGQSNPSILVDWFTPEYGYIYLQEISEWGCKGPLRTKRVDVDSLAPIVEYVTTLIDDHQNIGVQWNLLNDAHLKNMISLYKYNAYTTTWDLIDSFNKHHRFYIDKIVKTSDLKYDYKVSVRNQCNTLMHSHPHNSILLKGEKIGDFNLSLHWNEYINWPEGVLRYDIFRSVDREVKYALIESVSDTFHEFEAGFAGVDQCYRIVAIQKGNENTVSWSNEKCFRFDPMVKVPNSFTPNGDGLNDVFLPLISNVRVFDMRIYNRWGELIFQSDNPEEGWDGRYKGNLSPTGVYVVVIKYRGNAGLKSYTGTITLLR